jgi:hypothetical protein
MLALAVLAIGATLVLFGAPVIGVATLITAVAGLIGTAIYGHRAVRGGRVEKTHEQVAS